MKLVELLARELKYWPDCKTITQDYDGDTGLYGIDTPKLCNGDPNDAVWTAMGHIENIKRLSEVATDHETAIVTREIWQAERDRIAAPKQSKDGWIRHRGGKCPVADGGLKIEVRLRDGAVGIEKAHWYRWSHDCGRGDIMAYRVCELVVEPAVVANVKAFNAQAEIADAYVSTEEAMAYIDASHSFVGQLDGPLQWRDRITQIDDDIKFEEERHWSNMACMDQERADLVAKLAAEGFALIAAVVEPIEDMSDWQNWKVGDLLEIEIEKHGHCFSYGEIVKIYSIGDDDSDEGCRFKCYNMDGQDFWFVGESECKFHSRPTN